MSKLKNISIFTIVVVLSTIIVQVSAGKPASPLLKGAYRVDENGWIYVHLEGKPFEIGYQHGYLLADNSNSPGKPAFMCTGQRQSLETGGMRPETYQDCTSGPS